MIYTLRQKVVTSDNGRKQIEQQLQRLLNHHEQVRDVEASYTEWAPSKSDTLKLYLVSFRITYVSKPSTNRAQVKAWLAHKTRTWLMGFAVAEIGEVTLDATRA
jgi:hypothetical protein